MKRTFLIAALSVLLAVPFLSACGSSISEDTPALNLASVTVKSSGWSDGSEKGGPGAIYSQQFTRTYEGGRERLCTLYLWKAGTQTNMIDCVWADEAVQVNPSPR